MSNRGQAFIVEVKPSRKPRADYQSKPGDARRSGRAGGDAGSAPVRLQFNDRAQALEVRLGVVVVGAVTHDAANGWFWAVYLPGMPNTPKPARDIEAARSAISHKVREWCEAANLISARVR
ncbi:hypothetical protein [Bradyrhizobium sp. SZCCHNR1020]|uniref:hypothetical protein n=1 Tax=Bradyrhizobium sp. SZCCHNR1020 TaxID=3057343 RepID=UPI0029170DA0|nr:hypothetical protein [Bradyrhizobium sp. SZCCHNR1020]